MPTWNTGGGRKGWKIPSPRDILARNAAAGIPSVGPTPNKAEAKGIRQVTGGYQKWAAKHGQRADPLDRKSQNFWSGVSRLPSGATGRPYGQAQSGKNKGQWHSTYKLAGGKTANVYYDAQGKRKVNVF